MPLIAIDGPAGSGKSTVARALAARLGLDYLDTGAMYRSLAFAALRKGIDPEDAEQLGELARQVQIEISERVVVDGVDATAAIRDEEVTGAVSAVAAHPGVREEMVRRQREWAAGRSGGVVEGRDIGSVVFPDADVKVYLTASDTERAQRRAGERRNQDYDAVAADLARRDRFDSSRASSPLLAADDAMVIDTTGRGVDDIVQEVLGQL